MSRRPVIPIGGDGGARARGAIEAVAGEAGPPEVPDGSRSKPLPVTVPLSSQDVGQGCAPWGMLAALDLHGCDSGRLADPDAIRGFFPALVAAIGMRAHGPLALERFGDGELEGWSAMQFIETSSITVHADEVWGRCFVDVFSCRRFDPEVAATVAVGHFGGGARMRVLER
jgi:S-adenosylmethionine/arginine decarboxylase-like enzyme